MDRKTDVMSFLKVAGHANLSEVAAHLGVSRQGALRHLEALEERGLVEFTTASAPHGPGRPGHVYRLTEAAGRQFPSGHRELAAELVEFMNPDELERFFITRAERMEADHGGRLAGLEFADKLRELARLGAEHGHMTELAELPDGSFQLRHCNCPIGDVAARTGHPCHHEIDVYRRLLDGAVIERTTWAASGDAACTYAIAKKG